MIRVRQARDRKPGSPGIARYVICTGSFLSNLAAGMLNVALLDIGSDYGMPIGTAQWVVTLYLLTIAVCLPLMGRLGDARGKRAVHNGGFLLFMLGSLCCALAPNFAALLLARVVQGVGAAMYQATNMALIVSLVSPEHRGRALGIVSSFVAVGTVVGPSVGGFVVQWMTWQANFWMLAGFSALLWLLAQISIPKDRPSARMPMDGIGAALFAVSLGTLTMMLNTGAEWGFASPAMWLLLAAFMGSGCLFLLWNNHPSRWKKGNRSPFIQTALFRNSSFRNGTAITVITYMSAFSTQIVMPVFLRSEIGLEPALAGMIMVGYPLSLFVSAPVSGSLSDRFGSPRIMMLGLGVMVAALTALGWAGPHTSLAYVLFFIVLLGLSMGMITSPNSNLIFSRIEPAMMSLVGSMIALARNIGMMLGTVLGGALMSLGYRGVYVTAAACVAVAAASRVRIARKERKRLKERPVS